MVLVTQSLTNSIFLCTARIDTAFANECSCPVSCNYTDVDMRMSYAEFGVSATIKTEMNSKFYGLEDDEHPRNDSEFYRYAPIIIGS